ncbi:MAG: ethanolamine utilization protein EutH [Roseburia sp.]|nr:ethanolamine utilization protein EutH [Roseburia sp.]
MSEKIVYVMAVFAAFGALDRMLGNRFGLGEKFEEGIRTIGSLALSMVGMLTLAPVIANLLEPVVVPVFEFLGADPAMFAGSILANDMGGAPLAQAMAQSEDAGNFGGLIVGSMMGATVVFTIPASLGMVDEADRKFLTTGVLAGVVTIPIGAFAGGLAAGYSIGMILRNLVPIILFALLIALGLWKLPGAMIKGFVWFGNFIVAVISLGLGAGIVEALTGITIIPGMNPIDEGFAVVADIAMVLAGAIPLVHVITRVFQKPLLKLGKMMGMNESSAAGMVTSLANSIPMFGMIKDMDERGKVVNMAFAVSAAFVFGDHLGFTAGFNADMIVPVIVGKLVGGITAVIVSLWITRPSASENNR